MLSRAPLYLKRRSQTLHSRSLGREAVRVVDVGLFDTTGIGLLSWASITYLITRGKIPSVEKSYICV